MTPAAIAVAGFAAAAVAVARLGSPATVRARLRTVAGKAPGVTRARRPHHRRPYHLALAAGAGCVVLCGVVGVAAAVALIAATLLAVVASARLRAARRKRALQAAVVELCRAVAAELRAGRVASAAFVAAVGSAAEPVRELFRRAVDIAACGDAADVADAVSAVASGGSSGLEGLHRLVACWRVAAGSGAALAPAIDRVGDALQADIELERALATAFAGPRSTVRLLAALPLVGLLLGTAIGAHPVEFLLGSRGGLVCCVAALVLDAVGVAWSRRIAGRAAASLG